MLAFFETFPAVTHDLVRIATALDLDPSPFERGQDSALTAFELEVLEAAYGAPQPQPDKSYASAFHAWRRWRGAT